jgi:hypothetical protein
VDGAAGIPNCSGLADRKDPYGLLKRAGFAALSPDAYQAMARRMVGLVGELAVEAGEAR